MRVMSVRSRRSKLVTARWGIVLVLFLFALLPAHAEGGRPLPRNAISVSFPGVIGSTAMGVMLVSAVFGADFGLPVALTYERLVTDHIALSASLGWQWMPAAGVSFLTPWLEVDWHPFTRGLKGIFVGIATGGEVLLAEGYAPEFLFDGVGGALGWEWMLGDHWSMSIGGGTILWLIPGSASTGSTVGRVATKIGIGIGYQF